MLPAWAARGLAGTEAAGWCWRVTRSVGGGRSGRGQAVLTQSSSWVSWTMRCRTSNSPSLGRGRGGLHECPPRVPGGHLAKVHPLSCLCPKWDLSLQAHREHARSTQWSLHVPGIPAGLEQAGWAILGILNQPMGLDGERELGWVRGARAPPGLAAVALHLPGFDVEVSAQGDVANGLASAQGEHQGHHVRVQAWGRGEMPTSMSQSTEVAPRWSLIGALPSH